jgi:hypothetical protein
VPADFKFLVRTIAVLVCSCTTEASGGTRPPTAMEGELVPLTSSDRAVRLACLCAALPALTPVLADHPDQGLLSLGAQQQSEPGRRLLHYRTLVNNWPGRGWASVMFCARAPGCGRTRTCRPKSSASFGRWERSCTPPSRVGLRNQCAVMSGYPAQRTRSGQGVLRRAEGAAAALVSD